MSTIYMSQLSSALPLMEMEGDHHMIHHHHQDHQQAGHFHGFTLPTRDPPILFPFVISNNSSTSDSSSLSYGSEHHLMRQHQPMLDPQHMIGGSSGVFAAAPFPTVESIQDDMIERSSFDPYDTEKLQVSCGSANKFAGGKWGTAPAAKMRITRKTGADPGAGGPVKKPRRRAQADDDHSYGGGMSHPLGLIRVCSDCNTTKTPLWRSGPSGPKSLCNACGIRQRKVRRAMMATGVSTSVTKAAPAQPSDATTAATTHPKVKKEKRADVDRSLPFKKRCKVVQDHACAEPVAAAAATAVPAMDHIDSIVPLSWNKSPASPAAAAFFLPPPAPATFAAQDEITDAAMLLMTLSCGLVRS